MKKTITSFILCIFTLGILAGCGSSSPAPQPASTPVVTPSLASTATLIPTPTLIPTLAPNTLTDQAGMKCEQAFASSVKNQAVSSPLFTLVQNKYDAENIITWHAEINSEKTHPLTEARSADEVQTLVCVQELRTLVGGYTDGTNAFVITWKVRLVRWADGVVVAEKSFKGGQPSQAKIHGGDGYGEPPSKEYREWLLNLFAGNSLFVQGVGVSTVAFSRDGKYLVVIGNDFSTKIWDVALHKTVYTQSGKSNIIASSIPAVFSPDQQYLALGNLGGVNILSVGNWKVIAELKNIDVWSIAFSSDGSQFAGGLSWGYQGVKTYETSSANELLSFPLSTPVNRVIITPDDKYLIAPVYSCDTCQPSPESGIRVWDLATGSLLSKMEGFFARDLVLLADGKTLAVAVADNKDILLYDLQSGIQAGTLKGHLDEVTKLAITLDGKTLASVDRQKKVILWDLTTMQKADTYESVDAISSLAFSPDGSLLAVGGSGGIVELWAMP